MAALSSPSNNAQREVLPTNVRPTHYDLTLDLDLKASQCEGNVSIELDVLEKTRSITLNAVDLKIHRASFHISGGPVQDVSDIEYDKDRQTVSLGLSSAVATASKLMLTIYFNGTVQDGIRGLFKSKCNREVGTQTHMISSQCQPVHAREILPCFDEPALKATFKVTIVAERALMCLSNMNVSSVEDVGQDKKAVHFHQTPRMSTYLLAFAVGEFNHIEMDFGNIPVRVYCTPSNNVETGRYALTLATETLKFYEEKFGVAFPLPKLDLIAIPGFLGAMENWGLVTFAEDSLLFDERTGSEEQKQIIALFVQHELAHMWFGNLVTMDFWDGLWLNEGFATWASMYSGNAFYPQWQVWPKYFVRSSQPALGLDSLPSSHPVEVPVRRAEEIGQIFDLISYDKGTSIIRMIAAYVGEDVFLSGVRSYMRKHKYGNTKTADLWSVLSSVSGTDVGAIMGSWTTTVGHPVVKVTEDSSSIILEQSRFLRLRDNAKIDTERLYPIPLVVDVGNGEVLKKDFGSASVTLPKQNDFFKVNAKHTGFYRTMYSSDRLAKLGREKQRLSVEDRVGIISDAMALASAGYQRSSDVLTLLEAFCDESQVPVWAQIADAAYSIQAAWVFESKETKSALDSFLRKLVTAKLHEIGWDLGNSQPGPDQELKALLFRIAVSVNEEETKSASAKMFDEFVAGNREAIHPDIRDAVFRSVLSDPDHGEKAYATLLQEARAASSVNERQTALQALGTARNRRLVTRNLELILSNEMTLQETCDILEKQTLFSEGINLTWEWFRKHADALFTKFNAAPGFVTASLVESIFGSFTSLETVREVEEFFNLKDTSTYDSSLRQSLDKCRVKARWVDNDRDDVKNWLAGRGYQ